MINSAVLVLNQNYEPLNISRVRRAVALLLSGKAEVVENNSGVIRSPSYTLPIPSVIRLGYLVKRPSPQWKLTRRRVFLRDGYTCQYCGKQTRELTLDHVIPRHLGGEHTWENVVSACKTCNHRKAGRTPQQAGMKLLRKPFRPTISPSYFIHPFQSPPEWEKYLNGWGCSSAGRAPQWH